MMLLARALALLAAFQCAGCSPRGMTTSIVETDLGGVWKLDYTGKIVGDGLGSGVETLELRDDGTYVQTFDDHKGGDYPRVMSTWKLVKNFKGRSVVILTKPKYYPHGPQQAASEEPLATASLAVENSSNIPFVGKTTLILCFEEADTNFCFRRDTKEMSKKD